MSWSVAFHREFAVEFRGLDRQVQDEIYTIGRVLEQFGPQLGRPRVDTLYGSRHPNMKSFGSVRWTGSGGSLSPSTPYANAVLLAAGNKSGGSARRFYRALIRKADERFDRHLAQLADEGGS